MVRWNGSSKVNREILTTGIICYQLVLYGPTGKSLRLFNNSQVGVNQELVSATVSIDKLLLFWAFKVMLVVVLSSLNTERYASGVQVHATR